MSLFINSSSPNRSLIIKYSPNASVSQLKADIFKKTGVPIQDQFLIYNCKPLEDSQSLNEYGIKDESTVDLRLRVRGGLNTDEGDGKIIVKKKQVAPTEIKKKRASFLTKFATTKGSMILEDYQDIKSIQDRYQMEKGLRATRDLSYYQWEGLGGSVISVAVSNDNQHAVCALENNSIKILNLKTKQNEHTFGTVHSQKITAMVLSKDNQFIVSASADKSIKVFNFQTKEVVHHIKDVHAGPISCLAMSDSGRYIISGSVDKSVVVIDLHGDLSKLEFKDIHKQKVTAITTMNNDRYIISAGGDRSLKVLDLITKEEAYEFKDVHIDPILSIAVSSDNKFIVTGSADKSIKIFDFLTKQEVEHFRNVHNYGITSVKITHENKYIITGSQDQSIKIFDLQTKQQVCHIRDAHHDYINSVTVSEDNRFIISGSKDESVHVYNLEIEQQAFQLKDVHTNAVWSVATTSDSKYIITASIDKSIKILDFENRKEVHAFNDAHNSRIWAIAISKDNKYIVSASEDKSIKIFNIELRQEEHHFENAHRDAVYSVTISNDMKYIVSGAADGSVKIFDVPNRQEYHCFQGAHRAGVRAVAVTRDNKYIVSASQDKSIKVFDMKTKEEIYCFEDAHIDDIYAMAVTTDGHFVVTGSDDRSIKVFDLFTKQEVCHFQSIHDDRIWSLVISEDNKYIVSCSSDKSIKILSLITGQQIHNYKNVHDERILSVALTKDNKYVISASGDKSLKIFNFPHAYTHHTYFISSKIPVFSAFANYDSFISSPDVNARKDFIKAYSDLCYAPYNWTIMHLFAILRPLDILLLGSYSEFKLPTLLDKYERTPLHYLMVHDSHDSVLIETVLTYIMDYLEDSDRHLYEYMRIIKSLSNLSLFIIHKVSQNLANRFLRLCYIDTPTEYNKALPRKLNGENRYMISSTPYLEADFNSGKNPGEEGRYVSYKSNLLQMNYNLKSEDMFHMILILAGIKNEDLFRTHLIKNFIDYIWSKTHFAVMMLSCFYSLLMLLLSVYISIGARVVWLEVLILALTGVFLAMELVQIKYLRFKYYEFSWNWIDLGLIAMIVAFIGVTMTLSGREVQWLGSMVIIVGYMRWVSFLRLFKATRTLIHVIVSIIQDMFGFMVILMFVTIGFSIIFLSFDGYSDYSASLYSTYKLLYADISDDDYEFSEKLLLTIILFLFNVLLLNLLISIMGDSFDKIQERRILIDALTRLDLSLEAIVFMKLFSRKVQDEKGYLIYCGSNDDEEDNDQGNEWEGRINVLKKILKQNENSIQEMKTKVEGGIVDVQQRMGNMENELRKVEQRMEHEITNVKQEVRNLELSVAKNHQEIMKAINNLKK